MKARTITVRLIGAGLIMGLLSVMTVSSQGQQARRPYRIGILNEAYAPNHPAVQGLRAGLAELGLRDGVEVLFEIRFTEGNLTVMPATAQALTGLHPDLIFTSGEAATRAAAAATRTAPIVFTLVGDPLAAHIIAEIAHPGGNVTGVSSLTTRLAPKRLETLRALVPGLRRVWAIYDASDPSSRAAAEKAQDAAAFLKMNLVLGPVRTSAELARTLQALHPGDGLLPPDNAALDIPAQVLKMSLAARLPAVFPSTFWVGYGALASYGSDYYAEGLQAASLVAKILHGAKPERLPVEGATTIELVVNARTAQTFGIVIPQPILVRADRVIQ